MCELVGAESVRMERVMSEIKRCPICGEFAHLFTWIDRNQKKYYGITCEGWHGPKDLYATKADAIAAWNRRYAQ